MRKIAIDIRITVVLMVSICLLGSLSSHVRDHQLLVRK